MSIKIDINRFLEKRSTRIIGIPLIVVIIIFTGYQLYHHRQVKVGPIFEANNDSQQVEKDTTSIKIDNSVHNDNSTEIKVEHQKGDIIQGDKTVNVNPPAKPKPKK
jgi:hypothetical protein